MVGRVSGDSHFTRKWTKGERQPEKEDLVFLVEEGVPPNRWKLGVITELLMESDGFTRNIHMLIFIYFVFLSYVLQPTFSADCGVQATADSLYMHLVVILPEQHPDEKQCLGTILHLQHNDTYSDTILTSKSCLKSKNLKNTVVVTLLDFSKTETLKGIHVVRSIFPKTLGHLASQSTTINSPAICLPQESEVNFPISRKCYLPTVYKNGRIGSPMRVDVHSKETEANYSIKNYHQMDLIVEAKSIFNSRKRIHQGEFITIGMPVLCIDPEKYFDVDKYFQYGIFDQEKTILKRDLSKLIYVFTSLFSLLNHIMFVVSTKEFHHGYPGVDTETS
ncbi:Serine/threonine protein phosphatase 2Aregulatory subunit B' eta isoform [Trichinella pseudospiralis]